MITLARGSDVSFFVNPSYAYDMVILYRTDAGTPINLTGQTVTMTFTGDTSALFTLTSGDGLTIDAAAGSVTVHISGARTTIIGDQTPTPKARYEVRLDPWERLLLKGSVSRD